MYEFRHPALLAVLAAIACLSGPACAPAPTAGTFRLAYSFYYERSFDSVDVKGDEVTYVHYQAPDTAVCSVARPCVSDSNLKTETAKLSKREAAGLASSIADLHLERVADLSGDTTGAPCREARLFLKNARGEKTLVYRSTTWSPPLPGAYRDAVTLLAGLVRRKFNQRIYIPRQ
jgi:hypothetical protein